jgi:AcrR family transcriptional regulator
MVSMVTSAILLLTTPTSFVTMLLLATMDIAHTPTDWRFGENVHPKTTYHHGNLRSAFITTGIEILKTQGVQALSLRDLARRIGVSHNAASRHFAGKPELLVALAEIGFQRLAGEIRHAIGPFAGAPRTRLFAASRAYIQFAIENPHLFRLMFCSFEHHSDNEQHTPALAHQYANTLGEFTRILAEAQKQGVLSGEQAKPDALVIWSLLHGLAMLLVDAEATTLISGEQSPEELVRYAIRVLIAGLENPT